MKDKGILESESGHEAKRSALYSSSGSRVLLLTISIITVICLAGYLENFSEGIPLGLIEFFLGSVLLVICFYYTKSMNSNLRTTILGAGTGLVTFGVVVFILRQLAHIFLVR